MIIFFLKKLQPGPRGGVNPPRTGAHPDMGTRSLRANPGLGPRGATPTERYKGSSPYGTTAQMLSKTHNNITRRYLRANMKVECRHCGCEWIVNAWDEVGIIRELDPCHVSSRGVHSLRGVV